MDDFKKYYSQNVNTIASMDKGYRRLLFAILVPDRKKMFEEVKESLVKLPKGERKKARERFFHLIGENGKPVHRKLSKQIKKEKK